MPRRKSRPSGKFFGWYAANPPTASDFRSQRAEKPSYRFRGVTECQVLRFVRLRRAARRGASVEAPESARVSPLQSPTRSGRGPHSADRPPLPSHLVAAGGIQHPGAVCDGDVMKHIRHANTLFYYDGPQVFEARDAIGGHYVAVLAPSDGADDRYLVAGVNPERLRQFRSGILDLRSLLVESDEEVRYLATASNGLDHPLTLERLPASFIGSELLPDFDFVLHDRPADEYVLREARARNNLILELAVEPPEAAAQHRIRSRTLAEIAASRSRHDQACQQSGDEGTSCRQPTAG